MAAKNQTQNVAIAGGIAAPVRMVREKTTFIFDFFN